MMTIIVSSPTRLGSTLKHPLQGSSGPAQFFSVSAVCGLVAGGRTEKKKPRKMPMMMVFRSVGRCLVFALLRYVCCVQPPLLILLTSRGDDCAVVNDDDHVDDDADD